MFAVDDIVTRLRDTVELLSDKVDSSFGIAAISVGTVTLDIPPGTLLESPVATTSLVLTSEWGHAARGVRLTSPAVEWTEPSVVEGLAKIDGILAVTLDKLLTWWHGVPDSYVTVGSGANPTIGAAGVKRGVAQVPIWSINEGQGVRVSWAAIVDSFGEEAAQKLEEKVRSITPPIRLAEGSWSSQYRGFPLQDLTTDGSLLAFERALEELLATPRHVD